MEERSRPPVDGEQPVEADQQNGEAAAADGSAVDQAIRESRTNLGELTPEMEAVIADWWPVFAEEAEELYQKWKDQIVEVPLDRPVDDVRWINAVAQRFDVGEDRKEQLQHIHNRGAALRVRIIKRLRRMTNFGDVWIRLAIRRTRVGFVQEIHGRCDALLEEARRLDTRNEEGKSRLTEINSEIEQWEGVLAEGRKQLRKEIRKRIKNFSIRTAISLVALGIALYHSPLHVGNDAYHQDEPPYEWEFEEDPGQDYGFDERFPTATPGDPADGFQETETTTDAPSVTAMPYQGD